jgi:NAD(P)-dependent dehydrogenase (short-subunit alcohol dehydrogenase family)
LKDLVITGSEGLIGKTLSEYFTGKGYSVACLDLQLGHDLTDEGFVKSWFRDNPAKSLINAFALNDHMNQSKRNSGFREVTLDDFNSMLLVNLTSLFSVCRQFIIANNSGNIVNFSSIYGVVSPEPKLYAGSEKDISYGVSKAGVLQLSRHLAVHAAPSFRVNSIVLGGIQHEQTSDFVAGYSKKAPLGRMANRSEVNGMVEFLISNESSYCTGSTFTLDGGWTAI